MDPQLAYRVLHHRVLRHAQFVKHGSETQRKGQVTCNGVNYDIPVALRVNSPSTDGIQTFQQFWSVRNPKKPAGGQISGTVDTACHFNAWKTAGLKMGTDYSFQILADERSSSTVSASITLSW